jgi:hypothetical protein
MPQDEGQDGALKETVDSFLTVAHSFTTDTSNSMLNKFYR